MTDNLPANLDAERFVLGSILLDDSLFLDVAAQLKAEEFMIEKHRRIWLRMHDLHERGERIDCVSLGNELHKHGQLESCDGIGYLVSLDTGMPKLANVDGYVRIVKAKALLRQIIFSASKIIDRCVHGGEEPEQILSGANQTFLDLGNAAVKTDVKTVEEIIQAHGGIEQYFNRSKPLPGVKTGYSHFDGMTGGFHAGELIILAARPAMGKTALALNIASHVATKANEKAVIFSLEMTERALLDRLACAEARVDAQKFKAGKLEPDEVRAMQRAASRLQRGILLDDTSITNVFDIHSKVRRLKARHQIGLVIVDYLQLMTHPEKRENRTQEVSAISRGLKLLAKDLEVPVLALSQLSRLCETRNDKRPILSDLRESGSIEQDADLVAFLFRGEVYEPERDDLHGLAELILAKQREGPTGKTILTWLENYLRFENHIGEAP